jgi:hypothetical protein
MSVNSNLNNPDFVRFTCNATASSASGLATEVWSTTYTNTKNGVVYTPEGNQHHYQWIEGWVAAGKNKCDRDEWPPRYFWPIAKKNELGQMVRFLPSSENRGAGSMWKSFCELNGEINSKGGKNSILYKTLTSETSVNVLSGFTSKFQFKLPLFLR